MKKNNEDPDEQFLWFSFEQALVETAEYVIPWDLRDLADHTIRDAEQRKRLGAELMVKALDIFRVSSRSNYVAVVGEQPGGKRLLRVWKSSWSEHKKPRNCLEKGDVLSPTEALLEALNSPAYNSGAWIAYRDLDNHLSGRCAFNEYRDSTFYVVDTPLVKDTPPHRQWLLALREKDPDSMKDEPHSTYMDLTARIFAGLYRLIYTARYADLMRYYTEAMSRYDFDLVVESAAAFLDWSHEFGAPVPYVVIRDYADALVSLLARKERQASAVIKELRAMVDWKDFVLIDASVPEVEGLIKRAQEICDMYQRSEN